MIRRPELSLVGGARAEQNRRTAPSLGPSPRPPPGARARRAPPPTSRPAPARPCDRGARRGVGARASFLPTAPLIPASDPWGVWAALVAAGAAGLWAERHTQAGKELTGALVATLVALALSNLGVIPVAAPQYDTVNRFLLPLAVPLLLFSADVRKLVSQTGRLLSAFLVGAAGTVLGTLAAYQAVPLASLGAEGWKVASALAARHIGGAVNYVSVAGALDMASDVVTAGLAADNLIVALYFMAVYAMARGIPAEAGGAGPGAVADEGSRPFSAVDGIVSLAVSAAVCFAAARVCAAWSLRGLLIPVATAITVALATAFPARMGRLVPSGEAIAAILMQLFFAAIGAAGSVSAVAKTAPSLFLFCAVQIAVHLGFALAAGRALGLPLREILLASNANVGGPTTAAGMAASKGWRSMLVPSLLVGTFGYATATFVSLALGTSVLRGMH